MTKNGTNGAVKFDLTRLGMADLEDYIEALRGSKFRTAAGVMAKCCVTCPAEWGEPNDPATFYNRPPVGEGAWRDVSAALLEAVNSAGE